MLSVEDQLCYYFPQHKQITETHTAKPWIVPLRLQTVVVKYCYLTTAVLVRATGKFWPEKYSGIQSSLNEQASLSISKQVTKVPRCNSLQPSDYIVSEKPGVSVLNVEAHRDEKESRMFPFIIFPHSPSWITFIHSSDSRKCKSSHVTPSLNHLTVPGADTKLIVAQEIFRRQRRISFTIVFKR
jgi:hypothetical protein